MYSIGDRVKINAHGFNSYGEGDANPEGVEGVVTAHDEEAGWFAVKWDNGCPNEYEAGTLDIVDSQ